MTEAPGSWLTFRHLAAVRGLRHAVTTRAGGVSSGPFATLNLGRSTADAPPAVAENRRRAAAALGFSGFVSPRQVHGARVAEVGPGTVDVGEADALVTASPGVLLGVLGADCPGVLLVDPVHRALAVVHSGWRGTALCVTAAAVRTLAERHGTRPGDLLCAVGPGISSARYEVGPDVADALRPLHPRAAAEALRPGRDDRWHADLGALLRLQLLALGVPASSIDVSPLCTYDAAELFFSHRRDAERAGRHALLAGWQ